MPTLADVNVLHVCVGFSVQAPQVADTKCADAKGNVPALGSADSVEHWRCGRERVPCWYRAAARQLLCLGAQSVWDVDVGDGTGQQRLNVGVS